MPHCGKWPKPDVARALAAERKVSSDRPRSDSPRCPCGASTLKRAQALAKLGAVRRKRSAQRTPCYSDFAITGPDSLASEKADFPPPSGPQHKITGKFPHVEGDDVPPESGRELESYIEQLEGALRAWLDCEKNIRPRIASLRETVANKIPEIQKRSEKLREVPGFPPVLGTDVDMARRLIAQMPEQMQIAELERDCEAPREKILDLHSAMQPCLDRFRCPELRDTFEVLDGITPGLNPATTQRFIALLKNILRSLTSPAVRPQEALGGLSDDAVLYGEAPVSYARAARFLEVTEHHIRKLVKDGKLDTRGQGHHKKITAASLRKYKGTV